MWWLSLLLPAWAVVFAINRLAVARHEGFGDPGRGMVIFVEPVRWLFWIWGFAQFCTGLRRGGFQGQTLLFRWSTIAGALLAAPDVMTQRRHLRKAAELAAWIERLHREHPGVPIHLASYSSGCYIALESLRGRTVSPIRSVTLLAGTISPQYDFHALGERLPRILNVHSPLDLINLLAPLVIGTNDRRWTPGSGAVGFASSHPDLVQHRWKPGDMGRLYMGDHFSVVSPMFVARRVAPLLWGELSEDSQDVSLPEAAT